MMDFFPVQCVLVIRVENVAGIFETRMGGLRFAPLMGGPWKALRIPHRWFMGLGGSESADPWIARIGFWNAL